MMPTRLTSQVLWANHERRVLNILTLALEMLREDGDLDINEDGLNRKLCRRILRANRIFWDQGEGIPSIPMYEAHNQPDANDEERARREDKKPDFQWGLFDYSEPDLDKSAKIYVIECKRLGTPITKSWVFNKNYVKNGIIRFLKAEYGYGKSVSSGVIVGYIRSMDFQDILSEVNSCAEEESLPEIMLSSDEWNEEGVSRLEEELQRPEVSPSPFNLRHLWADLRQQ